MTRAIAILLLLLACWMGQVSALGHEKPASENDVKVVYLYNFAKFVTWPGQSQGTGKDPLIIGFLDLDGLDRSLDLIKGGTARGHPLRILHCHTAEQVRSCHVLFLNSPRDELVRQTLSEIGDAPILTVGETDKFLSWGGVINFHIVRGRVRLEISLTAARHAGLRIAAQLLEIARTVGT